MPTDTEVFSLNTDDSRFKQRFKQELLKTNIMRMFVFCVVYALFQLAAYGYFTVILAQAGGSYIPLWLVGGDIWTSFILVALCLSVAFAVVFAVMLNGNIRNPHTQSFIIQAALILLTVAQLFICFCQFSASYLMFGLLAYLLMLGIIPLLARAQSLIYLLFFAVLSCLSYVVASPAIMALMGAETGDPSFMTGLQLLMSQAITTGGIFLVPAVLLLSIIASWLSFGLAQKSITRQLLLERYKEELEQAVEERTAELKEKTRSAEAANVAKTRFLTRVSHEMRTSLNTISGMAFLAREAEDPISRQESLDATLQASKKLKEIVGEIVDTTKIEMEFADDNFNQDIALLTADAALPLLSDEPVEAPDLSGRNILIVEDLETNRLVLREFLKDTKATVDEAENGLEAVEMFAQSPLHHYSFIFMDLLMPEMNGHDATRAIRKMERSDAVSIPIVAVSANAFKEDIEASLAAGMDAHLAKPVEQNTIFRTLIERLV